MWADGCLNQSKTFSLGCLSITWLPAINFFFCSFFRGTQRIVGSFFNIFNLRAGVVTQRKHQTAARRLFCAFCLLFLFLFFSLFKISGRICPSFCFFLFFIVSWRLCRGTWPRWESEQMLPSDWLTVSPTVRQGAKTWQEVALLGGVTYRRQGGERRSCGGAEEEQRKRWGAEGEERRSRARSWGTKEEQRKVGVLFPHLLLFSSFSSSSSSFPFFSSSSFSSSSSVSALWILLRYFNADKVLRKSDCVFFSLFIQLVR